MVKNVSLFLVQGLYGKSLSGQPLPVFKGSSRGRPRPNNLKLMTHADYSTDADDDVAYDNDGVILSTSPMSDVPCKGRLVLFSQTYLRGDNVTTSVDVSDLQDVNFDDKVCRSHDVEHIFKRANGIGYSVDSKLYFQ